MIARLKHMISDFLQPKAVILMYHQICERKSDPWELAVHPQKFEQQLSFLKNKFCVVPVEELAEAVSKKKVRPRMISITFDDGFQDNYLNAKPILESLGMPATFYCATHSTKSGENYWWERLEEIILHSETLPRKLEIEIGEELIRFQFEQDYTLCRHLCEEIKHWRAAQPPSNERLKLFLQLWKAIQPLAYRKQIEILDELRYWANSKNVNEVQTAVMNVQQLAELSQNPLFSIGAHTVHHAMLGAQPLREQEFEVQQSKAIIEKWLGKSINAFAYPYGNYTAETKRVLRDAGFKYAVSTEAQPVTGYADMFALPRMQVMNWEQKIFSKNLQKLLR